MEQHKADRPLPRFGAGLTEAEVRRLQTILREDCEADMTLPATWSRAVELLTLVEMLVQRDGTIDEPADSSTPVRASSLLTDSPT